MIAATLMLFVACSSSTNQTAAGTQSSAQLPTGTLDQLLAPIALYPDALLAQILMSAQDPPKVAELDKGNGFNAATGEYGDLVKAGVIDPVKVTRSALENAASIASLLLTTETLVVEKPAEDEPAEAGHGHGHAH